MQLVVLGGGAARSVGEIDQPGESGRRPSVVNGTPARVIKAQLLPRAEAPKIAAARQYPTAFQPTFEAKPIGRRADGHRRCGELRAAGPRRSRLRANAPATAAEDAGWESPASN